jgi:MFS family permease
VPDTARIVEWRLGWPLVLGAALGVAASAMDVYCLGAFVQPLEHEFGWSRSQITLGPTIVSAFFFVGGPIVGALLDRFGPRAVAVPSLIIYCLAFALFGAVGPGIGSWCAAWSLLAIGASGLSVTVWSLAISRRFVTSRGLALGIAMTGIGMCSACMPVMAGSLIKAYGWRIAFQTLGVGVLAITLPTLVVCLREVRPVKTPTEESLPVHVNPPLSGFGIREGLLSRRYWAIAVSGLLVVAGSISLVVHFVPIVTQQGRAREVALLAAGAIGLASIIGRCCCGYLLDRMPARFVGAVAFCAPILTCAVLLRHGGSTVEAFVAAAALGLSVGAEVEVLAYLTSRYFGLYRYGVLFGGINILMKVGVGVGPLAGGVVFDRTGGYGHFVLLVAAWFATSAALLLTLGGYPVLPQSDPTPLRRWKFKW